MGRRNTAKTGDKAVYNSRPSGSKNSEPRSKDDEFIGVSNASDDGSVGDDGSANSSNIPCVHNVMDLGVEEGSDSSDEYTEDEEENQEEEDDKAEDSSIGSSSGDEDSSLEQNIDSNRWGKKKSLYYHGDTADIEIGQDKEDAFDEEEAAKEIESSRFRVMDNDDFMAEENYENESVSQKTVKLDEDTSITASRDVSNFSTKEKLGFIKKQNPELLPLVTYFSDVCKNCKETTNATNALLTRNEDVINSVGATKEGQKYLLTKSIVGNSAALNVAIYLLLNQGLGDNVGDGRSISGLQSHPVMAQLQKCMVFDDALREEVAKHTSDIENQVSCLVEAIALMDQESSNEQSDAAMVDLDEEGTDGSGSSVVPDQSRATLEDYQDFDTDDDITEIASGKLIDTRANLMNEAKFGLRASEVEENYKGFKKRRKDCADNYFGDLNNEGVRSKNHFLASTINTLEQKTKKQRKRDLVEHVDETEEDSTLAQGLNMMEEELRTTSDSNEEKVIRGIEGHHMSEKHNPKNSDFYSGVAARSKERKAMKKKLYSVANKFPGIVSEVSGERAISRAMMKNRGLVAHKAKINRNPRVKKREQYRKALIRRKGSVREIRTSEGHEYAGEGTGIKSGISRSRKL